MLGRSLLENFNDTNVLSIEQPLLQLKLRSLPTIQLSLPTIAKPMASVDTDNTAVATQLWNLFPTIWKEIIIWWEIKQR